MSRLRSLLFALAALLLLVSPAAAADNRNFGAHLNAEGAVVSLAQGQATFQLSKDGESMSFRLIVANLHDTTQAHIHIAPAPGANGPVSVWLFPDAPPSTLIAGRFSGVLSTGTFTAADFVGPVLAGQDMDALLTAIAEGRAYVNVHTSTNPGGEIRGTIR